jgi:branched-chain amino acid transport system substrate-binding protein
MFSIGSGCRWRATRLSAAPRFHFTHVVTAQGVLSMNWKQARGWKQALGGLALGIGLMLASSPGQAADPGVTSTEITIGLFGPLSGPLVAYGIDPVNAARMLYEETNKHGGINGRKIKLVIEDSKCTANDLVATVKKLITVDQVFMLNGGSCTGAIAAAADYINREKVPYAMLNAAGDNAVFPPSHYVFGAFQATQKVYSFVFASFAAKKLQAKRAAVIVSDDDYGAAFAAMAKATLERDGGKVVAIERIPTNISDVTAPMLKVRAAKPDVIIAGLYPAPAVLVAQKYGEYGMNTIPLLMNSSGLPNPAVFVKNVANPEVFRNFYHNWAFTDMGDPAIHKKYLDMYHTYYPGRTPGPFMVTGLPSAYAVIAALKAAGRDLTRASFMAAMEKLDVKPDFLPAPLQFTATRRDALRTIQVMKFDGTHETVMPELYIWDGKSP